MELNSQKPMIQQRIEGMENQIKSIEERNAELNQVFTVASSKNRPSKSRIRCLRIKTTV